MRSKPFGYETYLLGFASFQATSKNAVGSAQSVTRLAVTRLHSLCDPLPQEDSMPTRPIVRLLQLSLFVFIAQFAFVILAQPQAQIPVTFQGRVMY